MSNKTIFETPDILQAIRWQHKLSDSAKFSLGWKQMDDQVKIIKGQLSIITGVPSAGKSNWLDAVMVNLANLYDWRFIVFSPESQPLSDHVENLITKKYQMPLRDGWNNFIPIAEKDHIFAAQWVTKHFNIVNAIGIDRKMDSLFQLFKHISSNKIIDAFVLDPWNEIEHERPAYMSETEYLGVVLGKIKALALEYNVHIFVVAHPTKLFNSKKPGEQETATPTAGPYDISGSANWYNKADNIFSVYRDLHKNDLKTTILVQKVKRARLGKVGAVELEYIPATASYK